jgi:hypothetical protein
MSHLRPKMFSEQRLSKKKLSQFKNITDFKNISEGMIVYFNKAGLNSPEEFIKLGWEKTWEKFIQIDYKCSKPFFGHTLLAAIHNIHRLEITDDQKLLVRSVGQKLRNNYKK